MPNSHYEKNRPLSVIEMFRAVAPRYDLMNRIISFGRDRAWRRLVVQKAVLLEGGRMLDVGAGTGMISMEALSQNPFVKVIAVDLNFQMIKEGEKRIHNSRLLWCRADAGCLPLPDASVNAVTSGYLLRNVSDMRQALKEQLRVLKPGGRVVCLDTAPPPRNLLRPMILFYMKFIIPILGKFITGNRKAYSYLIDSTRSFVEPSELAKIMSEVGFDNVSYQTFMFRTQVICSGNRTQGR